jgi:hypothetical protein
VALDDQTEISQEFLILSLISSLETLFKKGFQQFTLLSFPRILDKCQNNKAFFLGAGVLSTDPLTHSIFKLSVS